MPYALIGGIHASPIVKMAGNSYYRRVCLEGDGGFHKQVHSHFIVHPQLIYKIFDLQELYDLVKSPNPLSKLRKYMLILYGAPGSVFVRKPRILLQEKQIEFVVDPINLYEYMNDEFKQASPLKKIPALRDGNFTLADSSAICAYIDKKYPNPSFYPNDPQDYGKALWYEEYADTILFQAIAPCYYQTVLVPLYHRREPDKEAINTAINTQLPKVASYLENELSNKQFLVGNQFTIADVAVVSMFMNMYLSGFQLNQESWPNLSTYLKHHFKRESFNSCIKDIEVELLKISSAATA